MCVRMIEWMRRLKSINVLCYICCTVCVLVEQRLRVPSLLYSIFLVDAMAALTVVVPPQSYYFIASCYRMNKSRRFNYNSNNKNESKCERC